MGTDFNESSVLYVRGYSFFTTFTRPMWLKRWPIKYSAVIVVISNSQEIGGT